MRPLNAALRAAQKSYKYAHSMQKETAIIGIESLIGSILILLAYKENKQNNLDKAEKHLMEALTRCRKINYVEAEPDILLSWARWHYIKNDNYQALKDAEEALYIANRFEYRLKQAEIHNFQARIALNSDDIDNAKLHAEIAYERGWCDGPPYCYKPALDEAKEILKKLGVEPPKIE